MMSEVSIPPDLHEKKEDRWSHIKRRVYDSSAYYPGEDEVHEFYVIRQIQE